MQEEPDDVQARIWRILIGFADSAALEGRPVEPSTAVFGPGGIITDSLAVLDALCAIEVELDIQVPDEDLTEELFASVANLASYVRSHMASAEVV